MPTPKDRIALEKLTRVKDEMRTHDVKGELLRRKARLQMLNAHEAGVKKIELTKVWDTSFAQVGRMLTRARQERG